MNINSINSANTQNDNSLQARPVTHVNLNPKQHNNNEDMTSLSEHARMLQQREQQNSKALVDSIDPNDSSAPSDESIRVSSTIGRQISAGNFTRDEALDVYRSIQNLL
ncbi:hypothetical protein CBF23_002390 [Marinomonas agarivorans]|nr:hypothetical protein CBF23_002390 [Marinomonas agarivorans]